MDEIRDILKMIIAGLILLIIEKAAEPPDKK